jgi:hypothetical protein
VKAAKASCCDSAACCASCNECPNHKAR